LITLVFVLKTEMEREEILFYAAQNTKVKRFPR